MLATARPGVRGRAHHGHADRPRRARRRRGRRRRSASSTGCAGSTTTFSTYKEDSEISRASTAASSRSTDAHPDVARGPRAVRGASRRDARLLRHRGRPAGRDRPLRARQGVVGRTGGEILDEAGARNYAINAGGDMRLRGPRRCRSRAGASASSTRSCATGSPRSSRRPTSRSRPRAPTRAASTSSTRTRGAPPTGVLSVTVCGPDLGTADAYATAAFAMGAAGPHWTARLPRGYEAMTILADEVVLSTAGFPAV